MNKHTRRIDRSTFLLILFSFFFVFSWLTTAYGTSGLEFDRGDVFRLLRAGGFSGVLNQKVEIKKIGVVAIKDSCLNLFSYVLTSESKGGTMGARHMTKRLLVLSNTEYLGMYAIDDLPIRLDGNTLLFPGEKDEGNSITFTEEVPPKTIYLGGEVRHLFR
jgi:hypothetical protein